MAIDILVREIGRYMHPMLYTALDLTPQQKKALQRKFARYLAEVYRDEVKGAIYNQTLADKWVPLNEAYRQHKVENGLNPGMWVATSTLVESIRVMDTPQGLVVGIDRRRKEKDSGEFVYKIAKALEYGTSVIPPRPLFTPIYFRITHNMARHCNDFLRKEGLL